MKYELEPDNRNCPDDVLLNDLRVVAQCLRKVSLTKEEYNLHGRFSAATMQNRFGSWNDALDKSGLVLQKRMNIPQEELLVDLKRVASLAGGNVVTREQYRNLGKFSESVIVRKYGNWAQALAVAGLAPTGWRPMAPDDELFSNMADVWEQVGRQPKQSDFCPPASRFSAHTYVNRFGGWRKALEAFVAGVNDKDVASEVIEEPKLEPLVIEPQRQRKKTSRDPGWRLRYLVMHRDNLTCQKCGRSRVKHGVVLVLDHKEPWSKGGETTFENLQTLCEECNGGKSDLILPNT